MTQPNNTKSDDKYGVNVNQKTMEGKKPIVIIGANGSGKTTFAVKLSKQKKCDYIGAHRNISLPDKITMDPYTNDRTKSYSQITDQQKSHPWGLANDFKAFSEKFKEEESNIAIKFLRDHKLNPETIAPQTRFDIVEKIWAELFPKRKIDFSTNNPTANAAHISKTNFSISRLSAGERAALYLIVRVISAEEGIIIIDEPEIHFHTQLARLIWDTLENYRQDCRFIYVTHDLHFALTRNNASFIAVNNPNDIEIIEYSNILPDSIFQTILGAASFSISTSKILFCEGTLTNKMDIDFYSKWYNSDIAVIPVESCSRVIQCVEAMTDNNIFSSLKVSGIIDRDYWPDEYFTKFSSNINVLPYHELESILTHKKIFFAVAESLGNESHEIENKWKEFKIKIEKVLSGIDFNKTVLERSKKFVEFKLTPILNSVKPNKDLETIENDFNKKLDPSNWGFNPNSIFTKILADCNSALEDFEDTLKIFPGKTILGQAISTLGVSEDIYKKQLWKIFNSRPNNLSLHEKECIAFLNSLLPEI
ncbi:AAA family ATPase [Marinicellulosiphila megalodicopiae]|uniref:AAA family ATPase n=1 Tax=Marinicellulosiphila megalodicopiae TaxID=2724896 RepID=UPI003BAEC647